MSEQVGSRAIAEEHLAMRVHVAGALTTYSFGAHGHVCSQKLAKPGYSWLPRWLD